MKKAAPNKPGSGKRPSREFTQKPPYLKSQAVKILEHMANDEARRRYPSTPPEWLAPRKYRDDTANGLTKCIIHFLKIRGHQAERINNTGRPIDKRHEFTDVLGNRRQVGSIKWIPGSGTNGTADVSATIAGKSVKVEIKVGRDRQSQAQRRYQEEVTAAGGIYVVASSFEGFYNWYNQTFRA